eukprot:TRINITY_DN3165_c0_g1_i1.p1 TRINITY_DN3165_c0_g1~~TRINITY_DN3165_c0_g1_i1.p1  ORF type:complete len:806 (+),score=184.24 TRINITY_DN3165_c0_g1_i1:117-2534(+)
MGCTCSKRHNEGGEHDPLISNERRLLNSASKVDGEFSSETRPPPSQIIDPKLKQLKQKLKNQLIRQLQNNGDDDPSVVESKAKIHEKTVYEELSSAMSVVLDTTAKLYKLRVRSGSKITEENEATSEGEGSKRLCSELLRASRAVSEISSRASADTPSQTKDRTKQNERLLSFVIDLNELTSAFVDAVKEKSDKQEGLFHKINALSAEIVKSSSLLIYRSICSKKFATSAAAIQQKVDENLASKDAVGAGKMLNSCKVASQVMDKLSEAIQQATELDMLVKAITVCSVQLEEITQLVASCLESEPQQQECMNRAKQVRGAAVLLQIASERLSAAPSNRHSVEQEEPQLLLLSSAASLFSSAVVSLIDSTVTQQTASAAPKTPRKGSAAPNINVWKDKLDTQLAAITIEQTKHLKACTLNQLLLFLVGIYPQNLDRELIFDIFIFTWPTICSPDTFLRKIEELWEVPKKDVIFKRDVNVSDVQSQAAMILLRWVSAYIRDMPVALGKRIATFVNHKLIKTKPEVAQQINVILSEKIQGISTVNLESFVIQSSEVLPVRFIQTVKPDLIADTLTEIEAQLFKEISVNEMLLQNWIKNKNESPNVLRMINRFNNLSLWVASTIIWQFETSSMVAATSNFISIAQRLRDRNNFSSLFAVLAGLQLAPIYRLNLIEKMSKQQQGAYENLLTLMNSKNSFKNYRTALQSAPPPKIPYLGVHLTDLVFIDEGNPDMVEDQKTKQSLINFRKREQMFGVISTIKKFQSEHKSEESARSKEAKNPSVMRDLLENAPHLQQEDLWQLSLIIQPRK